MKKYYFSILAIVLFSINQAFAQFCPPTGYATPTNLYFIYNAGTSNCEDRPDTVSVGTSIFTQSSCQDQLSVYELTSGAPLSDPNNIAVDFGFSICEYSGGTLSAEEFEMIFKTMLKVYPNPITQGENLNIKVGINTALKVSLYSVTGKQMLTTNNSNLNELSVDISSLENGIYIAQIITDHATITRKVIVMK